MEHVHEFCQVVVFHVHDVFQVVKLRHFLLSFLGRNARDVANAGEGHGEFLAVAGGRGPCDDVAVFRFVPCVYAHANNGGVLVAPQRSPHAVDVGEFRGLVLSNVLERFLQVFAKGLEHLVNP